MSRVLCSMPRTVCPVTVLWRSVDELFPCRCTVSSVHGILCPMDELFAMWTCCLSCDFTVCPVAGAFHPVAGAFHPVAGAVHPVAGVARPVAGAVHPVAGVAHPVAGAFHPVAGAFYPVTGVAYTVYMSIAIVSITIICIHTPMMMNEIIPEDFGNPNA